MLYYGNRLNLPSVWDDKVSGPISETPEADRAKYIEVKLEEFRRIGNQNSVNSKNKSIKLHNKNLRNFNFAIYDKVLKHADVLSSKLSAIWEGPFTIIRIGDRNAYKIKDSDGNMNINTLDQIEKGNQSMMIGYLFRMGFGNLTNVQE
ncbi:hypothetical protein AYI69_g560 [Smittium culicis]|uniref:Uncharacterized protein n=1 Tax=Smittium culicis TaxID=133412 RepID=A0A1R1YST5_9FUNG|nr:hypothetical protein AYI69_g560 [Smittium culicis]